MKRRLQSFAALALLVAPAAYGEAPAAGSDPAGEALKLAAETNPGLLDQASLVYDSRALQAASPQHPKLIFTDAAGSFALAAAGEASGFAAQRLEFLAFNAQTGRMEASERRWTKDGFVERSPKSCIVCHGAALKPLWAPPEHWPGVYGSLDDAMPPASREWAEFLSFRARRAGLGRYARLPRALDTEGPNNRLVTRPNLVLNIRLARMNARRNLATLARTPVYPYVKFAVAAILHGCDDGFPSELIPAAVAARFRRPYEAYAQTQRLAGALARLDGFQVGHLRYLLENVGLSIADWSMTWERDALSFGLGTLRIYPNAVDELGRGDPDFAPVYAVRGRGDAFHEATSPARCDVLKSLSRESLARLPRSFTERSREVRGLDEQPVMVRCRACHSDPVLSGSGDRAGPVLPFDRPRALRSLLLQNRGALAAEIRRRISSAAPPDAAMPPPPYRRLSEAEGAAMEELLETLVQDD